MRRDEPESLNEASGSRHEVTAPASAGGERLDRFLAAALPLLSRSRFQALIAEGRVQRDGLPLRDASAKVRGGQTFAVFFPDAQPAEPAAQAIALQILHEDAELVVLDKPAGLVVHPAPGNWDRTLVNALIAHCGESLRGIGGVRRPGIVHRLDKDTSGVMVVAKTQASHQALVEAFAARRIERSYLAAVWGLPLPAAGSIRGNIGRSPRNRKKMAVLREGGRWAETGYRTEKALAGGAAALLRCRLQTGRTHQIRVHLASIGHPVIGDALYGRRSVPAAVKPCLAELHRQALHAETLGFIHPASGETLRFHSEMPADMRCLISCLETL